MADRHPGTVSLLRYFDYRHLPSDLGVVSMQFHHLAHELADRLPDSAELTTALRKLLEGKDAAVRAAIDARDPAVQAPSRPLVQSMRHDSLSRTFTVGVAVADGIGVEEAARVIAEEVRERLQRERDRSAAEQSRRRVKDSPQA